MNRYIFGFNQIIQNKNGDFVKYVDYQKLEAENKKLTEGMTHTGEDVVNLMAENKKLRKYINEFLEHWEAIGGNYLVVVENMRRMVSDANKD